jgi:putative ABC transport system substrate-binding protein
MKRILSLILAVTLVLGTLALASCSNQSQIKINPDKEKYVVGVIQLAPHEALDAATQGFMDALEAKLTAAGREVEFKFQNAQGDSTACTTIVNSFVADDVDLIMANATAALFAAANATVTIPVLGTSITEYGVALELDDFNGTVGGNISGTSDLAPLADQAQMMVDTLGLDATKKVGLLYCSSELNSQYQVDVVGEYLTNLGITVEHYKFADSNDLQTICTNAANNVDAIYVPTDNVVASNTGIINNVCEPLNIPVFAGEENSCKGCGYATLSISYYNIGQKTGEMAADILLGKINISETPVAYDAAPVKKYNKTICDKLGIDTEALEAKGYIAIVTE